MSKQFQSAEYTLGPALEFLQRLWALNHSLEKLSAKMVRRLGVTAQQRFLIRCLGRYPGMTAGAVATLLHVDPGTLSTALRRLEAKGLVQRRRDSKDARRALLHLTAAGKVLNRSTAGTVESAVVHLLKRTKPSDLDATMRVLSQLATCFADEASEGKKGR